MNVEIGIFFSRLGDKSISLCLSSSIVYYETHQFRNLYSNFNVCLAREIKLTRDGESHRS